MGNQLFGGKLRFRSKKLLVPVRENDLKPAVIRTVNKEGLASVRLPGFKVLAVGQVTYD